MPSCGCCGIDRQFDRARAEADLRRYRRRGPLPMTRRLLAAIRSRTGQAQPTLLDIGGGVGAIHHELLDHGFRSAVHVDRSQAFIDAAATEVERRGHSGRVSFAAGDFREVAASLEVADVVTLDRVVCCDPDYTTLLPLAAGRARRALVLTFPRDRWFVRLFVALSNAWRRLSGSDFRVFVHPPAAMAAVLERQQLSRAARDATFVWAVELWERATV